MRNSQDSTYPPRHRAFAVGHRLPPPPGPEKKMLRYPKASEDEHKKMAHTCPSSAQKWALLGARPATSTSTTHCEPPCSAWTTSPSLFSSTGRASSRKGFSPGIERTSTWTRASFLVEGAPAAELRATISAAEVSFLSSCARAISKSEKPLGVTDRGILLAVLSAPVVYRRG